MNTQDRSQAIRSGMAQAAREGRKPGRHRRDIDLTLVRQLMATGQSLRSIATALGVSHSLLSKRLNESDSFLNELIG